MATLTVRNVQPDVYRALKIRAAENGRSMEAEVRAVLEETVQPESDFIGEWLAAAESLRGDDFILPTRSAPRDVDLA